MNAVMASFLSKFSNIENNLETLAMNCLAVAGGYLVGMLLGGLVIGGLDKWVLKKRTPDFIKQSIRTLTGILVALLVALMVFGGGSGGEGDGGPGTGTQNSENDKKGDEPAKPDPNRPTPEPIPLPKGTGEMAPVRVTFLGGADVRESKAYLLNDDPARTFPDLTAAIKKLRDSHPDGIKLVLGLPKTGERVARYGPGKSTDIIAVEDWAAKEGIGYEWPEVKK